jgi:hypothetical protein
MLPRTLKRGLKLLVYSHTMERAITEQTVLAVDLDGTLIHGDLFRTSAIKLILSNPLYLLIIPFWLCRGRAFLKSRIAQRVEVDPAGLEYRAEVLEYVRAERRSGRTTVLATGSDEALARPVAEYLGCFDELVASDGLRNCTGHTKCQVLIERFGAKQYDYIGNSPVDLAVWENAAGVLVASKSPRFNKRVQREFEVLRVFS